MKDILSFRQSNITICYFLFSFFLFGVFLFFPKRMEQNQTTCDEQQSSLFYFFVRPLQKDGWLCCIGGFMPGLGIKLKLCH